AELGEPLEARGHGLVHPYGAVLADDADLVDLRGAGSDLRRDVAARKTQDLAPRRDGLTRGIVGAGPRADDLRPGNGLVEYLDQVRVAAEEVVGHRVPRARAYAKGPPR